MGAPAVWGFGVDFPALRAALLRPQGTALLRLLQVCFDLSIRPSYSNGLGVGDICIPALVNAPLPKSILNFRPTVVECCG